MMAEPWAGSEDEDQVASFRPAAGAKPARDVKAPPRQRASHPLGSEGSTRLGERVRQLRKHRRLSLRRTAEQLDISPSALSMIENGTGGSSLKRLQRIADYFGVALVDLLAEPAALSPAAPHVEVVRQAFATVTGVSRGNGVWYQQVSGLPALGVQVSLITFEKGGGYASDRLRHEGEEAHYVLLGSLILLYGDDQVTLNQGDLVLFNSQVEHSFENASRNGPATLLSVTTQAW